MPTPTIDETAEVPATKDGRKRPTVHEFLVEKHLLYVGPVDDGQNDDEIRASLAQGLNERLDNPEELPNDRRIYRHVLRQIGMPRKLVTAPRRSEQDEAKAAKAALRAQAKADKAAEREAAKAAKAEARARAAEEKAAAKAAKIAAEVEAAAARAAAAAAA